MNDSSRADVPLTNKQDLAELMRYVRAGDVEHTDRLIRELRAIRQAEKGVRAPNMAEDLLRRFINSHYGALYEDSGPGLVTIESGWVTVTSEEAAYLHSLEDQ